ncbi:MAG: hypothetical protein FWH10_06160 [Oscillospiraceae bacterium]|nr:hypothetical protein [Oscillospiraceae bacterium]
MFGFKFNIRIIKIILVLIIIAFFTPFFSVSCETNENDAGINFSGFDLSSGKAVISHQRAGGSPFASIMLILPVFLLILAFFINKIKNSNKSKIYKICKIIFLVFPLLDIAAAFAALYIFRSVLAGMLEAMDFPSIPISINIKYGFILYIFFNAAVFALSARNYFISDLNPPESSSRQAS